MKVTFSKRNPFGTSAPILTVFFLLYTSLFVSGSSLLEISDTISNKIEVTETGEKEKEDIKTEKDTSDFLPGIFCFVPLVSEDDIITGYINHWQKPDIKKSVLPPEHNS